MAVKHKACANGCCDLERKENNRIDYIINPPADKSKIQKANQDIVDEEHNDDFACNIVAKQFTAEYKIGMRRNRSGSLNMSANKISATTVTASAIIQNFYISAEQIFDEEHRRYNNDGSGQKHPLGLKQFYNDVHSSNSFHLR